MMNKSLNRQLIVILTSACLMPTGGADEPPDVRMERDLVYAEPDGQALKLDL